MVLELDFDSGKVVAKHDFGHFLDQDLLSDIFDHSFDLGDRLKHLLSMVILGENDP